LTRFVLTVARQPGLDELPPEHCLADNIVLDDEDAEGLGLGEFARRRLRLGIAPWDSA
jgi:hypothetical protein